MKRLIIDAGHGGSDPGATANGYIEKELTLPLARRLAELLKGYYPDMTREQDMSLSPEIRSEIVKDNYDYCLSVHFNAGGGSGIETIHSAFSEKGKALAQSIAGSLSTATGLPIRRVFSRKNIAGQADSYPVLRRGDKGEAVKELQRLLGGLTVDGDFGALTEAAVKEYQRKHGLAVDGIVGTETWAHLRARPPDTGYYKVAETHVVEVDPLTLRISVQDKPGNKITLDNFVTSGYQWNNPDGSTYPLGILVSEGKVINNWQPHGKPAGTLIVYKNGAVAVRELLTIDSETNVWFAVSGCTILPEIRMTTAGFTGVYADIARATDRPVIGYNPDKHKVIIAVRPDSTIARGQQTLKNLGCDRGITLDGGGSTILKVNGKLYKSTTRRLYSVVTW